MPVILIATFHETNDSVKHHLGDVGIDVQNHIDDGSLVMVDAFRSYYPYVDGMKNLVASLLERAKKEGRVGVTAIVDMGYFFLYGGDGKATELINYEASLRQRQKVAMSKALADIMEKTMILLKRARENTLLKKGKKLLELRESIS